MNRSGAGSVSGGELVGFAAERRPGVRAARLRGEPRQPDAPVALDVVRVDDEAERGGEKEGAGGSGAERQGDHRGERGNDCGNGERVHDE